jgi:holin-like protein
LVWLVLLQLLGVALNHWLLPMLPSAIIGLLLLAVWLMWRCN